MEQKKYLTLVAACAASFTLGAVLFASNGSVPLQGQLVALGDNERVVHTWDRNINDDHYVETHGYAFRPWNDMLYRSVYNSTKSAEYFFRNVEGGEYSVWVTYKKNAGMSYIRTYLADNMPMTVNTGTNSSTDSINMKAHWDEFKGSPNWEDEWVRVGNTFSVNPGNTLTVSFSNARGQGTSYPMLGHVKIIKEGGEGGGGGEGGPFCGDGAVDPDEECDDGNTANGDGCSSTCQAEVDRVAVYLDKDSDGTITGREGYERRHELMHAVNSGSRDTTTYDVNGNGVVGSGDVNAVNTYINARNELAKKVNIRDFLDVDNNLTNGYEVALQMNYLLTSINKGLTAENGDVNGEIIIDI